MVEKSHVRSLQISRTALVVVLYSVASAEAVALRCEEVLGRGGLAK
jgi:hypothetical protein